MASAKSSRAVMLVVVGVVVLMAFSTSTVVAETYQIHWVAHTNLDALADSAGNSLPKFSSDVAVATIEAGYTLRFKYSNIKDNLLEVTRSAMRDCDSSAPLREWTDGDTSVTFPEEGVFFFISGTSEQCLENQRLVVNVTEHHDAEGDHPHRRRAQEQIIPCPFDLFPCPINPPSSGARPVALIFSHYWIFPVLAFGTFFLGSRTTVSCNLCT